MVFSYSQITHYLRCPRSYRYRYLDGWQEKEARATMIFGRCFEKALAASLQGQDCGATLFEEWSTYRDAGLGFRSGENWDRLYHQGIRLLELFARDNRIRIPNPAQNLQLKIEKGLTGSNQFVGYIDAIGELDGALCVIDWKRAGAPDPDAVLATACESEQIVGVLLDTWDKAQRLVLDLPLV